MTVTELIEKLKEMPPGHVVFYNDREQGQVPIFLVNKEPHMIEGAIEVVVLSR
jgi:hypothetical protein